MFKVGRWRNEKIKVVFKLQFQAIQVPCSKSKLMIALVPLDVGQPTVRLGKTAVQNGICTWENPVYEALKITRETKTGKLQDKVYQFVISTGSSKSGFSGEVLINLADYVEATTPFTISRPIKSSYAGAILQVTIQNMQGADDERNIEENGALTGRSYEASLQSQFSKSDFDGDPNDHSHDDGYYNPMVPSDNERRQSSANPSTSNSVFVQKDTTTHQESLSDQSPYRKNSVPKAQSSMEKEHKAKEPTMLDWSSEDDIIGSIQATGERFPQDREQEPPKNLVEQLQREIFALKRQAEVTDIELQSVRRQVVKETKRGQDLSTKVVRLKEERGALKAESERLRLQQKYDNGIEHPKEMGKENKKSRPRQNEVEEDLIHAKDLNRNLRSQLRKTQDSNSELILVVRDLEEKLNKKEKDLENLSRKIKVEKAPEGLYGDDSESELASDEAEVSTPNRNFKEVDTLHEQIKNLKDEIEGHLRRNGKLEEQIKQFSQDYETAKKENSDLSSKFNHKQLELIKKERESAHNMRKIEELETQIARLESVIKSQAEEFSDHSATTDNLNTQVINLKHELERQAIEFQEELETMNKVNIEQEQRALRAEENLRKTKQENASAAHRLQEEFRELSEELAAAFKENEELTVKAETETRELRHNITVLEERLQKAVQELKLVQDQTTTELEKLSSQLAQKERELEKLLLEHKNESAEFSSSQKKAEDRCEALSKENQALRMEVERLTEENYYSVQQLGEMKTLIDETKTTLDEIKVERDDLETKYNSAKTEIKQYQEDIKTLRRLKEELKEKAGAQSQLEDLQAEHNQTKSRLSDIKSENENLKRQVGRPKENLQKRDLEIAQLEKLKDSGSKEISALKEKVKQLKKDVTLQSVRPAGVSPENGSKVEEKKIAGKRSPQAASLVKSSQNMGNKISAASTRDTTTERKVALSQTSDLLTEVASLKEKNKSMEDDLKEMQEKYSDVSLKFAEVESERQQLVMTIRNLRNGQKT